MHTAGCQQKYAIAFKRVALTIDFPPLVGAQYTKLRPSTTPGVLSAFTCGGWHVALIIHCHFLARLQSSATHGWHKPCIHPTTVADMTCNVLGLHTHDKRAVNSLYPACKWTACRPLHMLLVVQIHYISIIQQLHTTRPSLHNTTCIRYSNSARGVKSEHTFDLKPAKPSRCLSTTFLHMRATAPAKDTASQVAHQHL